MKINSLIHGPIALSIVLISSTASFAEIPLHERLEGPKAGAHQGGTYQFAGNTMMQFKRALTDGIDVLEMDLRPTKDGIPMVTHDETLGGRTWCHGKVRDRSYGYVSTCRYISSGLPVASFEQVLAWAQGRVVISAQFKEAGSIKPAIDLVKKYNAYEWVYFQANTQKAYYKEARDYDQNVALLFSPRSVEALNWALDLNDNRLMVIEIHPELRKPELLEMIKKAGKLTSENSWHFSKFREFFGATCAEVFKAGIDIAISERTSSCVEQRKHH